ncbi:DNA replication complex GINS protein psf2 [Syncephalis fuscata]|nr:DNA replication complex GINS protein psf2 [Syncephalis fuscata]
MALSVELSNGLSPAEIEFLAENALITIEPSVRTKPLELIQGTFAPLQPQPPRLTQVPIWVALTLRKRNQCRIVPPEWFNVDFLTQKLEEEQEEPTFSALPFNYMEIGNLLLNREVRQAKARLGLSLLNGSNVQMDNIGWMELNEIRPFFTKAFQHLQRLEPEDQENH